MSIYSEAIGAIRSIVLVDERLASLAGKVDRLTDEIRDIKERLIRVETMMELVKPDGVTLRIGRMSDRGTQSSG